MDHRAEYERKKTTPEGLAAMIESGWSCVTDAAASIPPAIVEAMGRRAEAGELTDVKMHGLLDLKPSAMFACPQAILPVSWFSGKIAKAAAEAAAAIRKTTKLSTAKPTTAICMKISTIRQWKS